MVMMVVFFLEQVVQLCVCVITVKERERDERVFEREKGVQRKRERKEGHEVWDRKREVRRAGVLSRGSLGIERIPFQILIG